MQISGDGTTAGERSSQHALRALLILGGFVAIWWALMTGVAQADSTPHHHLVDHLRSQVKVQDHHASPVRDVVRRVHHDVRTTTAKVRHQVRHEARPATHAVSSVVDSTPLAPVATKVTKTLHTTVSTTVATTRELVSTTALDPVIGGVEETVKGAVENPESSTVQGNSHSKRHSEKAVESTTSGLLASTSGLASERSAAADRHRASTDANGPVEAPRGTPSLPGPCSSPSGSGSSSSSTPVGITESSLLVMPTVLGDHHAWRHARLPGGPAYQPGSSPD